MTPGPRDLALVTEASRMLAEAQSLPDIRKVANLAKRAKDYAHAARLGLDAQNSAAAIALEAEAKAGELLARMAKSGERRAQRDGIGDPVFAGCDTPQAAGRHGRRALPPLRRPASLPGGAMTVQERHSDILAALDARLADEALAILRIEARLRELVSDAIERAPAVAAWASGKVAVGRLGEPGNDGGGGGRPIHPPAHPGARP